MARRQVDRSYEEHLPAESRLFYPVTVSMDLLAPVHDLSFVVVIEQGYSVRTALGDSNREVQ